MNDVRLALGPAQLCPLASGALWWPDEALLAVGDLHLGRSERMARLHGVMLPPYEAQDTLERLEAEINANAPRTVVSVGDSFDDDIAAETLPSEVAERLQRLAAGREWIWIAGNHDPRPHDLPGTHRSELARNGITFRHIATRNAVAEVSAHYHPKARLIAKGQRITRRCFLADRGRIILPAFGTYTGGMRVSDPVFDTLMAPDAVAVLTGRQPIALPRAALMR